MCQDADGDGYRDCIFPGCQDDDECVDELAGQCTPNEEPRCIARACVCRDLCGADCGEDRQCCALPGTTATCIDDPGPCANLACDPGFGGVASSFGDWSSPQCDYADSVCSCEELPPLPPGASGSPHVLRVAPDGTVWAVGYNSTYGDVVVAEASGSPVTGWRHVDGVPPVSAEAPIVAGPSGPRGGVAEEGDDVGRYVDAAFTSDGTLHIVARDKTNGTLRHLYGAPGGPMTARVLDGSGDGGFAVRVAIDDQDRMAVAHVARRTAGGLSELRVLASDDPTGPVAGFETYVLDDVALSTVACQGGCAEGFVCPEPANPNAVPQCVPEATTCQACDGVCTASGCQNAADADALDLALVYDSLALVTDGADLSVFGHDARDGSLIGLRRSTGNLYDGSAAFVSGSVLTDPDADLGGQPAAVKVGAGFWVAASDATNRQVLLEQLTAAHVVSAEQVIDDGARPHSSGAIGHNAVDLPQIAVGPSGDGILAWQDGTEGAIWGRTIASDGTMGSAQILGGAGVGPSFQGFYGLSVGAAYPASGPVVAAMRVWLSADPPLQELVVLPAPLRCPDDDPYEDNDDQASAALLTPEEAAAGIACGTDEDFYDVVVPGNCDVSAELVFKHAGGDLDLRLLDSAGTTLDSSLTVSDYEVVSASVGAGTYTLRVYGFNGAENGYVLRVAVDCP